ncbi:MULTISPECIES: hypothetical protein [Paraburkholderia]|uniref:Uncharacterized protein n=2 Tax=Paraburkholderia TaxID=1822464 RepID=A0ABU9R3D6_9BURK
MDKIEVTTEVSLEKVPTEICDFFKEHAVVINQAVAMIKSVNPLAGGIVGLAVATIDSFCHIPLPADQGVSVKRT